MYLCTLIFRVFPIYELGVYKMHHCNIHRIATWIMLVVLSLSTRLSAAYADENILHMSQHSGEQPMNVLFVMVDDLRPQFGPYLDKEAPDPVHPDMHTPNLDALAGKSLVLKKAYVQQALCGPSRTSMLTSRRPDTTHTHDLYTYWRKSAGNFTTIPQYFKEHGYNTAGLGKIFHPGHVSGGDDPISWTEKYYHAGEYPFWGKYTGQSWHAANDTDVTKYPLQDMRIADKAISTMNSLAKSAKPFFLAVGFHRPHLPLLCPQSFYDLYPTEKVRMPPNHFAPHKMPEMAWSGNGELRQYRDFQDGVWYGGINDTLPDDTVLSLRSAYYSCISYTDSLIGRVVDNLKALSVERRTIVVFMADHGWNIGENALWTKLTNFETAVRAPLMFHKPGLTDKQIQVERLVEFVDVFPTLAEVAGLPTLPLCPKDSSQVRVCTEGVSMVPLITQPERLWKNGSFSQYPRMYISGAVHMGYTVRTRRFRYTEWAAVNECKYEPRWSGENLGVELYDHVTDPQENENVASLPAYTAEVDKLRKLLHSGWRAAMPSV